MLIPHEASQADVDASQDKPQEGYRVAMPPERYIPLAVNEITDSIRSNIPHSERSVFTEICQLLECLALTEFSSIRRRVKKNFRFFSAAAMHRDLPTRKGRGVKNEEAMDEMEMVFLRDFWDLMDIAHYKVLSPSDWLAVKQERLELDMPLTINWDCMDDRMLKRFFLKHPERADEPFKYKHHSLIFHRGVGVVRKKDLFIAQKIDLLVKYLVAWPAKQVFYKIVPYLWKSAKAKAEKMKVKDAERDKDPNALVVEDSAGDMSHKHARHITRVSLRLVMPTYKAVFSKMFKQVEVVEPTYKDIITLHRNRVQPPTDKELAKNPALAETFRRDQRGIVIKRFDEVPVADLEVVLPDKNISLKLIDLLTLYGTAVAALIGGIVAFVGAAIELSYIVSTMAAMGGKLFQTYSTMERKKADLMKQMAQKVFDISMDAQEGALYSILDEMADQYIKEMLLAYFILLKHKYPVTEDELDEMCEAYLEDRFDVKIDFAIEESLPRLLSDGLIERMPDDDPRLKAASIEDAQARLLKKWQTAFCYNENADNASLSSTMTNSFAAPMKGLTRLGTFGAGLGSKMVGAALGGDKKKDRKRRTYWFSSKKKDT